MAAICTLLVAATFQMTAERIEANEQAWLERSLEPALSGVFFEGSVTESKLEIPPPHDLPGNDTAIIYRVFAEDAPVAALFAVTARDGYAGPIRILVGVGIDGMVTGVRIVEHRETPGLGDRIDQSRSDWVYQFDSRSLADPVEARWLLAVDGGEFDQLTGASVTPRAVIKAIRDTLLFFDANRDEIFTVPANEEHR
jgi:electron transport complex protein RnfG